MPLVTCRACEAVQQIPSACKRCLAPLPIHVGKKPDPEPAPVHAPEPLLPLKELERQHILKALKLCHGDRRAAARMLGISNTNIYRKANQFKLSTQPTQGDAHGTTHPAPLR